MSMTITQGQLDRAALVLIIGDDGLYEWSATDKTHEQIAHQLHKVAEAIRQEARPR